MVSVARGSRNLTGAGVAVYSRLGELLNIGSEYSSIRAAEELGENDRGDLDEKLCGGKLVAMLYARELCLVSTNKPKKEKRYAWHDPHVER